MNDPGLRVSFQSISLMSYLLYRQEGSKTGRWLMGPQRFCFSNRTVLAGNVLMTTRRKTAAAQLNRCAGVADVAAGKV